MKLTIVATPPTEKRLRALKQLGADYAVHYDMHGLPDDRDALRALRDHYARYGLPWRIAESGPAIDRIVLGKEGAAEQTERYKRIIGHLGALGVEVIAYNFMPQVSEDAMVVRTTFQAKARGGAPTSGFRLADVGPGTMPHGETPIPRERMWENLERFLRAVLPAAEAAGVKLAMHPDDPPLSPLCGLERIMDRQESFDRLLAFSPSPANALTFCVGCFAEMGADIVGLVERYQGRIAYVHVRDISGTLTDFIETFPDEGQTDLVAIFRKLHEIGFDGYVRSDHAPLLATDESDSPEGYGMQGHIFAIGYLRGLDRATAEVRSARR
ncbi:mannonate dehydratase [Labrys wisconsinensis]|uniref:mannonate dehydratase n=1 Tax=Labrys wisconsinensis TaxID=425677 RepID=A0ABU0J297_9HYPH|nr:mannonate dehydratase [Labrys wisconsinensis]MDQ0468378.1 mannonate dehydratase [Labrys wisconsinensis]